MKIRLTREIAWAAGTDAGNESMRRGNRKKWNVDDYNAACEVINGLMDKVDCGEENNEDHEG